ncbi:MAG: hypothetical protein LBG58_00730 [Planctomycetaceae bacterium]|jgi:hypothetical protein|nr:hypothetical protein [Planctomycetaceae bacterium]
MKTIFINYNCTLFFILCTFWSFTPIFAQVTATVTDAKEVTAKGEAESDAEELSVSVQPGNDKKFVENSARIYEQGKLPWKIIENSETLASFKAETPNDAPGKTYTSRFRGTFKGEGGTGKPIEWKVKSEIYVKNIEKFIINVDRGPPRGTKRFEVRESGSSRRRPLDIGHATWKIEIPSEFMKDYPDELKDAANTVKGLGADSQILGDAILNACRSTPDGGNITFSVPGILSGERPGSKVGEFQIKSKETVKSALSFTHNVIKFPPNYANDYNCADACISAINSAGKTVGDCTETFKLVYYPNERSSRGKKTFNIILSDPRKLAEKVKDFK